MSKWDNLKQEKKMIEHYRDGNYLVRCPYLAEVHCNKYYSILREIENDLFSVVSLNEIGKRRARVVFGNSENKPLFLVLSELKKQLGMDKSELTDFLLRIGEL